MTKLSLLAAVLFLALISGGCAALTREYHIGRRCHREALTMYWADGTHSTWPITICEW